VNSDGTQRGLETSNEAVLARGKVDRTVLKVEKITCRYMGSNKARMKGLGPGGKRVLYEKDPARWVEAVNPGGA
jgi:hypothetical protein